MIVRLKDVRTCVFKDTTLEFQFYDSPIKRRRRLEACPRVVQFQFYDSPIKSGEVFSFGNAIRVSIL